MCRVLSVEPKHLLSRRAFPRSVISVHVSSLQVGSILKLRQATFAELQFNMAASLKCFTSVFHYPFWIFFLWQDQKGWWFFGTVRHPHCQRLNRLVTKNASATLSTECWDCPEESSLGNNIGNGWVWQWTMKLELSFILLSNYFLLRCLVVWVSVVNFIENVFLLREFDVVSAMLLIAKALEAGEQSLSQCVTT